MQTVQTPPMLRSMDKNGKRLEAVIQGKKIIASFADTADDNILKLVKKILVDSHTTNAVQIGKQPFL